MRLKYEKTNIEIIFISQCHFCTTYDWNLLLKKKKKMKKRERKGEKMKNIYYKIISLLRMNIIFEKYIARK